MCVTTTSVYVGVCMNKNCVYIYEQPVFVCVYEYKLCVKEYQLCICV